MPRHTLAMSAVMSLDEIVPGATVRFTVIDGKQYMSVRDVIMHVCGKDKNQTAEIWRRMSDENKAALSTYCNTYQFPGRGQSEQPVITFPGAILLNMFLPGIFFG